MGCALLLEAPRRGKEVTRRLLRSGQIPDAFLKETGWVRARLRSAVLRVAASRGAGELRFPRGAAPLPLRQQPFQEIKGLFSRLTPLNLSGISSDTDV